MMTAGDLPWRATSNGLVVRVRLTPKAAQDSIGGIETTAEGPAIKARVRALPSEGEANAALTELLAAWIGVPKSRVALIAGGKSRIKSLVISGEPTMLAREVAAKIGN